jgi:hypothetical protein
MSTAVLGGIRGGPGHYYQWVVGVHHFASVDEQTEHASLPNALSALSDCIDQVAHLLNGAS